jgi:hypothetical protein
MVCPVHVSHEFIVPSDTRVNNRVFPAKISAQSILLRFQPEESSLLSLQRRPYVRWRTRRILVCSQMEKREVQEDEDMDIDPEQLVEELCELVAKETDFAELRRLIARLIESLDARQKQRDGKADAPPEQQST